MVMKSFAPLWISLGLVVVGSLGNSLRADVAPKTNANDQILQQVLKQQQIRTTTQRVGDQLENIIAEFDRNGIAGEDVKVLRAIRGVLGRLTEKDMDKVLAFLQQARTSTDPNASTRNASDAYAGQKTIVTQLKQLVLEYQRQQALYEISIRLKDLANRESANMWLGVWLAKTTEGKPLGSFDEGQKSNLKIQEIDQENIKEEVNLVLKKLEKVGQEITDGPTAERSKQALTQANEGGLHPAMDTAVTELKTAKLLSASGNEKKARDQLREIARLLTLSQDTAESLRQAIQDLDRAIDEQKQTTARTRAIENKDETTKAETKQAEVVDSTDLIRKDVESLAPVAAEQLKNAEDRMQEARSVLSSSDAVKKKRENAPPKQEDALVNMAQARRALEEQLAKVEEETNRPENNLVALKELQEELRDLVKKEESLKTESAAAEKKDLAAKSPKQGELKDKAQDLQQRAANTAPDAAQSIGEATTQMQKSQADLAKAQNNAPAQQAAIDALQRADQQLSQQIAKLEEAQKQLAALEELKDKLEKVIKDEQGVQFSTAKEAVKPEVKPAPELSSQQEKLGNQTGELQKDAQSQAPKAASHLGSAKENMSEAKAELDKPAPKSAQPKENDALADLYSAKKEIDNKIGELKDKLGLPQDSAQSLADAAAAIEQAQKEVNEAMSQMQQNPDALESLQQQQRQIADALSQMAQANPKSPQVGKAQKSADQAAQELAKNNIPGAIGEMKQAKEGIDAAQASDGDQKGGQGQGQGQGSPSLPDLSKQQAQVEKAAEDLLAAQQATPADALQQAGQHLEQANNSVGPLSAGSMGPLPGSAQSALQAAQKALANGSAQASAGQGQPAQANASSASQALAEAQAALALAQAGLSSDAMASAGQGQGKKPGQGQGKNPGEGKGQGQGPPSPDGNGRDGNWNSPGGADGPRRTASGAGQFTGLPKRDRAAIQQSQSEKYPQEYGALVEQYLKNLSDQSSGNQ